MKNLEYEVRKIVMGHVGMEAGWELNEGLSLCTRLFFINEHIKREYRNNHCHIFIYNKLALRYL